MQIILRDDWIDGVDESDSCGWAHVACLADRDTRICSASAKFFPSHHEIFISGGSAGICVSLAERNQELREEVRWHEAQQLERGWGSAAGAAAGPGTSAKGGPAGAPGSNKSRPGKAIAIQTEPLAFLPPLECVGAGPLIQPDAASSHATPAVFGAPQRSEGSIRDGGATAPGGRPKPSSAFVPPPSVGPGAGAGGASRLRSVQTVGRTTAVSGAARSALPTSWRAEQATLGKSAGPAQWQGQERQYDMDDEYETGCADDEVDEAAEAAGDGEQQGSPRQSRGLRVRNNASPSWNRGGAGAPGLGSPSSYSYVQNDDVEVMSDEGGGPDGMDSEAVSALAWQQHQEFMAKVSMGQDDRCRVTASGSETQSQVTSFPATEARQQRPRPSHASPPPPWVRNTDTANPNGDAYPGQQRPSTSSRMSRHSEQPQQRHKYQESGWSTYVDAQGPRQSTIKPAAAEAAAGPMSPRGSVWQAYSDHGPSATGPGPEPGSCSSAQSSPKWSMRSSGPHGPARSNHAPGQGVIGRPSAFFGPRSDSVAAAGAGPRSFPSSVQSSSTVLVVGPMAGAGAGSGLGPGAHRSSPLHDSVADLDGVSKTLAALRMDRHVEAAAAAAEVSRASGIGGPGMGGVVGGGHAGASVGRSTWFYSADQGDSQERDSAMQRNSAMQQPLERDPVMQRPGTGAALRTSGLSQEAWSPRSSGRPSGRGPAKPQNASTMWGPPPNADSGGWDGVPQRHSQSASDGQQWQGFPPTQQQGQPHKGTIGSGSSPTKWPKGTMRASAADAASVAHSISYQQHLHGSSLARPSRLQATSIARDSVEGGGVGDGKNGSRSSQDSGVGIGSGAARDAMLREVRHADGKTERMYASGTRLVMFANGTRKVALPDGSSRVYFANGDIKWTIPDAAAAAAARSSSSTQPVPPPQPDLGVVHYYYAEVATWHSTYGGEGGVEVFYFPSGQTEAHHPGHGKEIMFPDGVLRVVTTDGEELDVTWQQLSWAVQQPQPQVDNLGDDDL
ncbi:hypothetical protein Vretimale_19081 [Volvox reticuliferus]|uniref:Centromere protein J C-terminal domain-containing protein n=1 Tax=Volvox reticuliferus TaxID=1737510 RepID=A0A8J4LYW7_9CHLO|nr:hypothetical protein Vretimale_19081 [Volvox reticuliferus]